MRLKRHFYRFPLQYIDFFLSYSFPFWIKSGKLFSFLFAHHFWLIQKFSFVLSSEKRSWNWFSQWTNKFIFHDLSNCIIMHIHFATYEMKAFNRVWHVQACHNAFSKQHSKSIEKLKAYRNQVFGLRKSFGFWRARGGGTAVFRIKWLYVYCILNWRMEYVLWNFQIYIARTT